MGKKQKMYLVYKITNIKNNKYYIGAHETYNINDNYFGSGIWIKRAIEKYGLQNFKKEILYKCSSQQEMFLVEKNEIEKNGYYPNNPLSYNLKDGGKGGWIKLEISPFKGKHFTKEQKENISRSTYNAMWRPDVRQKYLIANSKVDRSGKNNTMYGDNRIFISNNNLRKIIRIHKQELESYLKDGWIKGISKQLKYFTYEGAYKGEHILVLMNTDIIPLNYYRGQNGHFVSDTKIDQKYVHPTKRK